MQVVEDGLRFSLQLNLTLPIVIGFFQCQPSPALSDSLLESNLLRDKLYFSGILLDERFPN